MEIDSSRAIFVEVANHILNLFLGRLKPESSESDFELLGLNGSGATGVEQVEGLLNLLLLALTELLPVCLLGLLVVCLLVSS